ncbi:MAG: hypothetical protein ACXW4Z_20915, partial [Candidatus Binatia bacterium]
MFIHDKPANKWRADHAQSVILRNGLTTAGLPEKHRTGVTVVGKPNAHSKEVIGICDMGMSICIRT